jgi:hypothetical protein
MWKAELEKKGSDMSVGEAYEVLGKYIKRFTDYRMTNQ